MRLVQRLVLGDHALLVLEHLVELFELLGEENGLVAHHRVDLVQILVLLRVDLGQLDEARGLGGLPKRPLLFDLLQRGCTDLDLFDGAGLGPASEADTSAAGSTAPNREPPLRAMALDRGASGRRRNLRCGRPGTRSHLKRVGGAALLLGWHRLRHAAPLLLGGHAPWLSRRLETFGVDGGILLLRLPLRVVDSPDHHCFLGCRYRL